MQKGGQKNETVRVWEEERRHWTLKTMEGVKLSSVIGKHMYCECVLGEVLLV